MINKTHHDSFKHNVEQNLAKFIGRLPDAPDFDKAEPIGAAQGMYDLSLYVRKAGGNDMALVGDAALTTDPIAGAGCGWALQSAEWLVDCITPELRAKKPLTHALEKYASLHAKNLHQHQKLIARYSSAPSFLASDGALFSLLARDPKLQQWFHAIYSRNRQPAMSVWPALKLLYRSLRANPPLDRTNYNWDFFNTTSAGPAPSRQ